MRAVKGPDQYTTLPQALERSRSVGDAHENEIGRRGKTLDPDGVERLLEAAAVFHDAPRLLLEHRAVREEEIASRGRQHVHVVGQAQLLEFIEPFARPDGAAQA